MSKAILILEMPIDCEGCDMFYVDKDFWRYRCKANYDMTIGDEIVRQKWCPLKPMPSHKDIIPKDEYFDEQDHIDDLIDMSFNEGYNKCIDEILGDEK